MKNYNLTDRKTVEKPKKAPLRRWYSDSQKIEAVKLWLVVGNMPVVAASLNIPLPTLKQWRYMKWWEEITKEIKSEDTLKLSNKLKVIAEKALDITIERLENGDWFYDQKTGEIRRKAVSLKDAAMVASDVLDKRLKLEERPQQDANQQKIQDRLAALADAFTKLSQKTHKVEVIDAVYHEWKEGLQEGAGVGAQEEAEPGEGSGSSEFSKVYDGEGGEGTEVRQ